LSVEQGQPRVPAAVSRSGGRLSSPGIQRNAAETRRHHIAEAWKAGERYKAADEAAMIQAYVHGIYPRSKQVVMGTRDLDRGRTTPEVVAANFRQDLEDLIELQTKAGMDFYTDGLLRWHDLFRPLVDSSRGLASGALVRWFDNNTFFRAPEVDGEVSFDGGNAVEFDVTAQLPKPWVATLPSPYLFSRVAVHDGDSNQLMLELARKVIRPVADQLVDHGCTLIHLQEPWIVFHGIDIGDWKPFIEAVRVVTEGLRATTVLHTYFGDGAPIAARLFELPVDAIGFDFTQTDLEDLDSTRDKGLLIGCIDGRRSLLEGVEDVVALVERVVDKLHPQRVFVSSASDLELLPEELARMKVVALGTAARLANELV
jgi:5-methyltetrahydropteroyltriglutamate--homocysteine methyltransferase